MVDADNLAAAHPKWPDLTYQIIIWGGLAAAVAVAVAIFVLTSDLVQRHWRAQAQLRTMQDQELIRATEDITRVLDRAVAAAAAVATTVQTAAQSSVQPVESLLPDLLTRHGDITAIAVAYAPFADDPRFRLAAPLVGRTPNGITLARVEDDYDYTADNVAWYRQAMVQGASWSMARYDGLSGEMVIDYARKVVLPQIKSPTGQAASTSAKTAVIRVSFPLKSIADIVAHLELGRHGYGALVTGDGQSLVVPGGITTHKPFSSSSPTKTGSTTKSGYVAKPGASNRHFLTMVLAAAEKRQAVAYKSTITGHYSRLLVSRITGPNWLISTVYSWQDLEVDRADRYRDILIITALAVLLPLGLAAAHLVYCRRCPEDKIFMVSWLWSSLIAAIFTLGIGVIWALSLSGHNSPPSTGQTVASRGALDTVRRAALGQALLSGQALPDFVPTGVFIQSIEFVTANNVMVSGYLWQRLAAGSPVKPGLILPEAESTDLTEAFRYTEDGQTVVGWRLRATLRQNFSYARFPFDHEAVWLRLWPSDRTRSIVLVPDFSAYDVTNPSALPGLEQTIVISGWKPLSTFFEYRRHSYNTQISLLRNGSGVDRAELYYTVEIRRNFLDPFVSHITPILLVLLLIFAMQMTVTRDAERKDLLGFNAATIITTCAALFFAVLISHIEVRGTLSATQIFYGEYFYLITYAVILFACINAILFTYDKHIPIIQYHNNILPKVLYWPSVMGSMYAVTFAMFFN